MHFGDLMLTMSLNFKGPLESNFSYLIFAILISTVCAKYFLSDQPK